MEHFLEQLAGRLWARHGSELDRVAVVLPGRRAGIHLRKYLAQAAGRTVWSPELFDPGSFMARIAGMRQGVSTEMLFMLYAAHRTVEGDRAEALPEFLQWAPTTLRDMSEIDSHLLHHDLVYRDLQAYQEIEEWSFSMNEPLSASQQRLVHQWQRTRSLHAHMHRIMQERAVGTGGAVARKAVDVLKDPTWRSPWNAVWFAGLNALEPASRAVIKHLVKSGVGHMAWNADHYYLDDPRNEAGHFLRHSIEELGPGELPIADHIVQRERSIAAVAVPNRLAQVHLAAEMIAALDMEQRSRTVVVLADEDLLLPFLNAMPADIGPMNVTMGVPLTALPIHGLLEAFLDMHAGMNNGQLLLADLERLLMHSLLHEGRATIALLGTLRSHGNQRVDPTTLFNTMRGTGAAITPCMESAFSPIGVATDVHTRIRDLITWAGERNATDRLAMEQLFQLARIERGIEQALQHWTTEQLDARSYRIVRERALRDARLPLFGEPLTGLQVMGLLETRAIDHERVIVIGANEESLAAKAPQSWIPHEIRRHHKLPSRTDTEAITAHHIHSLLHGATDLRLVHDAGGETAGGPTRFVAQWQHELVPRSNTRIHHSTRHAPLLARGGGSIAVEKTEAVQARISALAAKGFSPSALGTWLRCPLDFYFQYVLGIRSEEVEHGKLGSNVLGTAVHKVLEEIYKPHLNTQLRAGDLHAAIPQVADRLRMHLHKDVSDAALNEGHFKLSMEMAANAIGNYLQQEATRCATEATVPLRLEAQLTAELPSGDKLRGTCDRIEERNGLVHVLDLKTGAVKENDLKLKGLEREHITSQHQHALQLLIYAVMTFQDDHTLRELRAGIVPLRKPSGSDGLWLTIGGAKTVTREMIPGIESLLQQLVNELRDPANPFGHDPASEWCASCVG